MPAWRSNRIRVGPKLQRTSSPVFRISVVFEGATTLSGITLVIKANKPSSSILPSGTQMNVILLNVWRLLGLTVSSETGHTSRQAMLKEDRFVVTQNTLGNHRTRQLSAKLRMYHRHC